MSNVRCNQLISSKACSFSKSTHGVPPGSCLACCVEPSGNRSCPYVNRSWRDNLHPRHLALSKGITAVDATLCYSAALNYLQQSAQHKVSASSPGLAAKGLPAAAIDSPHNAASKFGQPHGSGAQRSAATAPAPPLQWACPAMDDCPSLRPNTEAASYGEHDVLQPWLLGCSNSLCDKGTYGVAASSASVPPAHALTPVLTVPAG